MALFVKITHKFKNMKSGPIVIVEDDVDDKDVLSEILKDLKVQNKLVWFNRSDYAFQYLLNTKEQPFIIISDVNMPGQNGLEFKKQIDSNPELRKKCIPFIFYSTAAEQEDVNIAYLQMTVQGFFKKGHSFSETSKQIKLILDYWKNCWHPNV